MKENAKNVKLIEKFNFWKGIPCELGLLRTAYTEKIFQYAGSNLVKVMVGQRRVGKSYLLRQILSKLLEKGVAARNTLYINKEFTEFDFLNSYRDLEAFFKAYKLQMKPRGKVYLFIDEIQNIEGWEKFINSLSQNFTQKCEIFISGSNSKMLSGELATLLSGRYVQFEIFPLSFDEFLAITKKPKTKQSYLEYMETGGLPELFKLADEESRRNYVAAIKDTVLLRDIIQHFPIKHPRLLEDVFVYLVNSGSSLVSISNIVKYFKSHQRQTTYDTVANYIEYLTSSFLLHKVERFSIRGKETLVSSGKYYANDLSFQNYLYAGNSYGVGYRLENLVYLQLRRMGYEVFVGSLRNKEIDFVARKNDQTLYLQVAYLLADEATIAREYSGLEAIADNYRKYVLSLDDIKFPSRNGIEHLPVWDFAKILW